MADGAAGYAAAEDVANEAADDTPESAIAPLRREDLLALRRSLLDWYAERGRSLPWRQMPDVGDPYKVWVSEIMLQQTQVKTVLDYYRRWLVEFPTVEALAAADLQRVLKAWEGLGYYSRARNLHRAAREVRDRFGGQFPRSLEAATSLPGIGRTTAGGILSAAFDLPVAILDGNVKRVLARLVALEVPPARAIARLWRLSEMLLDRERSRDFNQALMDLGATVCRPRNPACGDCPWMAYCEACRRDRQQDLPMREAKAPLPHKTIGVAIVRNDRGEILIDRRLESGLLGGLWEFPGGKLEPGETMEDCIRREIREELDIEIRVDEFLIQVDHAYTHFKVSLHAYLCDYVSGEPKPLESMEVRWTTLEEIDRFPFPKANIRILEALRERLGGSDSKSVSS